MMTGTIQNLASVTAPEGFALRVRTAAHNAAHTPVCRTNRARVILITAVLLLVSVGAAAGVINWAVDQFFTEEAGFRIPGYEWGSPDTIERESTMSVGGYTGDVLYQYENGGLLSVTISFNRQNQPGGIVEESFLRALYNDMCAAYGPVSVEYSLTPQQQIALQKALREYLDPMSADRPISPALSVPTPQPTIEQNKVTSFAWIDDRTNTAIQLSASYMDDTSSIRVIRITVTELNK